MFGAALTFIRSPLGIALAGALAFAAYTGFIWVKATSAANDAWEAKLAVVKDQVRAEEKARNDKIAADLMALAEKQRRAKEAAETEAKELRDAIAADKTDTTVRVSPHLDGLFRKSLGLQGDIHQQPRASGGAGQSPVPAQTGRQQGREAR